MEQNSPSATAATIRKQLIELSDVMLNPKLRAALEKVRKDKQLFRQAKADPKGFLKGEGVPLPPRTNVTISRLEVSGGGSIKGKITVEVCFKIKGFKFCGEVEVHGGASF